MAMVVRLLSGGNRLASLERADAERVSFPAEHTRGLGSVTPHCVQRTPCPRQGARTGTVYKCALSEFLDRAHLLTTDQGSMVVLPDGSRAPSGDGSAGVPFPAGIYQQTPTAACALGGAALMRWGLGGHRPPTSCAGYIPTHCLLLLYRIRYNRSYTETSIIPKSPWKADKAWLLAEIFGITFYWILYSRKQKMPPRHRNSV